MAVFKVMKQFATIALLLVTLRLSAQEKTPADTLPASRMLDSITITAFMKQGLVLHLPDTKAPIYSRGRNPSLLI